MKIKNVKQALEAFETSAVQQEKCVLENTDDDRYEESMLIISQVADWLFEHGLLLQLSCFYEHKNRTVRRLATFFLLAVDTQKAETMLAGLAQTGDADAKILLREWLKNKPVE